MRRLRGTTDRGPRGVEIEEICALVAYAWPVLCATSDIPTTSQLSVPARCSTRLPPMTPSAPMTRAFPRTDMKPPSLDRDFTMNVYHKIAMSRYAGAMNSSELLDTDEWVVTALKAIAHPQRMAIMRWLRDPESFPPQLEPASEVASASSTFKPGWVHPSRPSRNMWRSCSAQTSCTAPRSASGHTTDAMRMPSRASISFCPRSSDTRLAVMVAGGHHHASVMERC